MLMPETMPHPDTGAETRAYLHQLAYQVESAYWPEARQKLAAKLHELADHIDHHRTPGTAS